MDQSSPQFLASLKTPAPALSRGLALMHLLRQDSPRNLESLSKSLKLPKASVSRLLETLEKSGVVLRTPEKGYEPLFTLEPLPNSGTRLRQKIDRRMPELSRISQCSVEWYEPSDAGLHLVLQHLADSELCVKAKPGFLRTWDTEFEAVTRLGHAFYPGAPSLQSIPLYRANGELTTIPKPVIQELIDHARIERSAHDVAFNTNGVRRFAVAAIDEATQTLIGVLALAQGFQFGEQPSPQTHIQSLQKTLNS